MSTLTTKSSPATPTEPRRGLCSGALLDIGADTGALVIYADRSMVGEEVEICPSGDISRREHNVVRQRMTPTGLVYAAVFPAVREGRYAILDDDGHPYHEVSVLGGRVTEFDSRA